MGSETMNNEWSSSGRFAADYEVFLNFRGTDTRQDLIDILRHFMMQSGIRFFYDDDSMHKGDVISEELLRGIERSHIYILMLSKSYVESKWCMRELAHMVKCQKDETKYGRKVFLPVFCCGVSVENVKLKEGSSYKTALEKLNIEEERRDWSEALKKVAAIKGLHFGNHTGAVEFSQAIVREVQSRLTMRPLSYHLVGIDEEAQKVEDKLDAESCDVRYLVIHGKEGTGKTTLARAVFQRLSARFQGCSFITDVSEMSRRYGFVYLEHILMSDICGDDDKKRKCGNDCKLRVHIKKCFRDKKVLIVLDGVDKGEQIENLAGTSTWFGPGSRIIITTSVREVLSIHQDIDEGIRNSLGKDSGHKKEELNLRAALQLFSRYAFQMDSPLEPFNDLSSKIVNHSQRLPLILEIVGSFLHRKRTIGEWNEFIKEIFEDSKPVPIILLKIYGKLEPCAQKVFLDIACFFINEENTNPTYMWDSSSDSKGLESLLMLSLVKIGDDNKLWMHDYLRDLGRDIVHRESHIDRSRFWDNGEAFKALTSREGHEKVQAICLYYHGVWRSSSSSTLTHEHFRGKHILRFLRVCSVEFSGDFEDQLRTLTWLSWHDAPEEFTANNFATLTLVILDLARSHITAEWDGWRQLKEGSNLKVIDLTSCGNLKETPSFSQFSKLERIVLENCSQLTKIDSSIHELQHLRCLNVKGCDSLEGLPEEICSIKNLTEILIMKRIRGSFSLPRALGSLKSLTILEIVNVEIIELPESTGNLEKLQRLSLLRCSRLKKIQKNVIGKLQSLVELEISKTTLIRLSKSIRKLKELRVIKMEHSSLNKLPRTIGRVEKLEELHAKHSEDLTGEIPDGIGMLSHLKVLDLSHTSVTRLPETVSQLSHLQKLQLPSCCESPDWSKLPKSLTNLRIRLPALPQEPSQFKEWSNLEKLELHVPSGTGGKDLIPLHEFPRLKSLHLSFEDLQCCTALPASLSKLVLENTVVQRELTHFNELEKLSSLELHGCKLFANGSAWAGMSDELMHFYASGCEFYVDGVLHLPKRLRSLYITDCSFQSVHTVIHLSGMDYLKQLDVWKCTGLVQVDGLGELALLEELKIHNCIQLEILGGDISKSKRLRIYDVGGNDELRVLTRPSPNLENLEYFELTGSKLPSTYASSSSSSGIPDLWEEVSSCSGDEQREASEDTRRFLRLVLYGAIVLLSLLLSVYFTP